MPISPQLAHRTPDGLYTLSEMALFLGVSPATARGWTRSNRSDWEQVPGLPAGFGRKYSKIPPAAYEGPFCRPEWSAPVKWCQLWTEDQVREIAGRMDRNPNVEAGHYLSSPWTDDELSNYDIPQAKPEYDSKHLRATIRPKVIKATLAKELELPVTGTDIDLLPYVLRSRIEYHAGHWLYSPNEEHADRRDKYPLVRMGLGKRTRAHRAVYEVLIRPLKYAEDLRSTCDHRFVCVNPACMVVTAGQRGRM